eukprot:1142302-Pelagomonas_calceolata.AAC.11
MNNRFKPDPDLKHRGVLLLDDDILMSCADIGAKAAGWCAWECALVHRCLFAQAQGLSTLSFSARDTNILDLGPLEAPQELVACAA